MRLATWISFFQIQSYKREFPYIAQSPTLVERIEYKGEDDLLEEVDRILAEPGTKKFGIGQSLYYQLPLFCDPDSLVPDWCWDMLADYNACKKFHIPLSNSLDNCSCWLLDCFNIIESEINKCSQHKKEKDG